MTEQAFLIGGGQIHRLIGPRGETPPCPEAKYKRGDVVKVRIAELESDAKELVEYINGR